MRAPRRPRSWKRDAAEAERVAEIAFRAGALILKTEWSSKRNIQSVKEFFDGNLPRTIRIHITKDGDNCRWLGFRRRRAHG